MKFCHEDDVQGNNISLDFKEKPEKKVTTCQKTQCDPKHQVSHEHDAGAPCSVTSVCSH